MDPETPMHPVNGDDRPPDPPVLPRGELSNQLTPQERAFLLAAGVDPEEAVAVVQPASAMDVLPINPQTGMPMVDPQGNPVVVVVIQLAVPRSILPLPTTSVLDPSGNVAQQAAARKAFLPYPPMGRLLLRRDALSPQVQEAMQRGAPEEAE